MGQAAYNMSWILKEGNEDCSRVCSYATEGEQLAEHEARPLVLSLPLSLDIKNDIYKYILSEKKTQLHIIPPTCASI